MAVDSADELGKEGVDMTLVWTLLIGIAAGVLAFVLLGRATTAILQGDAIRALLPMLGNLAVLLATLLLTAFLAKSQLVPMGIGLAAGLIGAAIVRMVIYLNKKNDPKGKDGDGE